MSVTVENEKTVVHCPHCNFPCQRKGEREYRHVGGLVVRYYCAGNCKRYHMRSKDSGEVVTPPEGWTRGDSLRGRTSKGKSATRIAELEAEVQRLTGELETSREVYQTLVDDHHKLKRQKAGKPPVEEQIAKVFGIKSEELEWQKRPDTGKPRVIFNALSDEEIAKLDPYNRELAKDMQRRVMLIYACILRYKGVLSGKVDAPKKGKGDA